MTTSGQKKDLPGEKLFEMMECLGMEPTGAPVPRFGHMLASAFHTCKSCQSVEQCREWLAAAAKTKSAAAPDFCLNTELLAEFLFEPLMKKEP